ncbi:MAG: gliding motility-associated ABC transporter ATP-binding subunit GldA [Chitinophagales bacterium]|nr:gliding motility-associated ABC transporter ATP-binding subunit GldA [Chitinophagales bacterium]MDW8419042.1 gliding motility-associated ABC transporter ATP-binding subunit GldA [Chitinophagales bacterium]
MSVKVIDLTKIYGSQMAVDHINFEAVKGKVLGFLGPNGAGKSTTMKIITGFIPPSGGKAEVCGYDPVSSPIEVASCIGYLPEHNPLYRDMYVREYLGFVARLYKGKKISPARIDEMIELTGLTPERKKKVGQLSKGYRQRVGLAQALLHDPEVLILDEPTSGLDPIQLIEIRQLIKQLGKNKTVIFSSHIMQEVQAVADRVIIIHKGKIVADDNTADLQSRLANEIIVTVEFKQAVQQNLLSEIKGVKRVEPKSGNRWTIYGDGSSDLREELFCFATRHKLTLLHLAKEEYSLEEVFKQLTRT